MEINSKLQAASHSGAKISVYQNEDYYYVKKVISDYSQKDLNSIQLQVEFCDIASPSYSIKSIPIVSTDVVLNELTVHMPYIEGLTGEQLALKGSKNIAKNIKLTLDFYLMSSFSHSKEVEYPKENIHRKLIQIKQNLPTPISDTSSYIDRLISFCDKDLTIPVGPYHGDLTFSNIKITDDNKLFLFDFLESEIKSPLQDIAKLNQDIKYGWSLRKEKQSSKVKGEIFFNYSKPNFIAAMNRIYKYELMIIEALTIFRIAPYIIENDSTTINWFNSSIKKALKDI